ncbi:hypothetical protein [Kitasatospora sp. NPDC059327]|uniref:hypothetical protein n=1 Tax=Kitasatospora sp. NPDC059327 TaxID=3346803 RepID=UPI003680796B
MSLAIAAGFGVLAGRCDTADVRAVHGHRAYEDGAVVPSGPWRPLTRDLARGLAPAAGTPDDVLVELVDVKNIDRTWLDRPGVTRLGRALSPADGLTTTSHHGSGLLIGLHLDNWDRLPYAAKHTGRRRLCINLGPGTRYLLVCDQDAQTVCRAVHSDWTARYPHTDDLRSYVIEGRPVRCYRLRLDPGDGYVAPTEFLPHDGSTEGQQESTAAFWLGRWPSGLFAAGNAV